MAMAQTQIRQDTHLAEFFLGLLAGLVLGGSLSILLTPQSGRQTRELPARLRADWNNPYGKTRKLVNQGQARLETQWEAAQGQQQARRLARAKKKELTAAEQDSNFLS